MSIQFKQILKYNCGIRFIFENLKLISPLSTHLFLEKFLSTNCSDLNIEYKYISEYYKLIRDDKTFISKIEEIKSSLAHLKDVRNTIDRLSQGVILDDIELYEIKNLIIISINLNEIISSFSQSAIRFPNLERALSILDPENKKINSFYIYNLYDNQLSELRDKLNNCDNQYIDELNYRIATIEERVRKKLCQELTPFIEDFKDSLFYCYRVDLLMAKVGLIIDFNLSIPNISTGITKHHGLFNPEIVNILKKDNKEYQKIDIEYNNKLPKLITGSNMGGKSLTLKTLALSQIMFQFGLGVPSENSSISIVDDIEFIYGDQEDYSAGLSSFAAEIKRLDGLISRLSNQQNLLVLIDEPARTTNPLEGTALVSSLIKIISEFNCFCVITTHYHIKNANCDRIRVVGFDNGKMNYSLIDDCGKSIPMEALKIASYLGINNKWLNIAYKELETNNNNI